MVATVSIFIFYLMPVDGRNGECMWLISVIHGNLFCLEKHHWMGMETE